MPSRKAIIVGIRRCMDALPRSQHPADEFAIDDNGDPVLDARGQHVVARRGDLIAAETWERLLDDTTDESLLAAVDGHLRDPEKGRWWPTVADLRARMELEPAGGDDDEHEQAWEWIVECARKGLAKVDLIGPEHRRALQAIGGIMAVRMSGDGNPGDERVFGRVDLAILRKRFLAELRRTEPARPALTDRRPTLRALPGGLRRIGEG